MKTIKLMTACAAAFMFASCLQMEEPASIEALRTAKAELISAEVQYKQAETAMLNAQVAYQQSLTEYQNILNKIEELKAAKKQAENDEAILKLEQAIELLEMEHQINVLNKKQELARAEQNYADALLLLAEQAKGISAGEEEILNGYLYKLNDIKDYMSSYQAQYETAVHNYVAVQHNFTFDYEMYKAKYLRDVAVAEKALENATEFQALLAEVNGMDHLAAYTQLNTKVEAAELELKGLKEEMTIYEKEKKEPYKVQIDEYENLTAENLAKVADLECQQKHIYLDNEAYYRLEVTIPSKIATDLYNYFNYGNYLQYTNGFAKDDSGNWTAVNGKVTIQFPYVDRTGSSVSICLQNLADGMMFNFVDGLASRYEYLKDYDGDDEEAQAKATYYKKAQNYLSAFNNLVDAAKDKVAELDDKIYAINAAQLEIDLKKSALDLELSKVNVQVAALQKEYDNKEDALVYVKELRDAYEGFVMETEADYPVIKDLNGNELEIAEFDPAAGFVVEFESGKLNNRSGNVEDVLAEWAEFAEFAVFYAEKNLARAEAMNEAYTAAESPMVVAQAAELDAAEAAMVIAKAQYEYYKSQFNVYTKLFNEFLAQVIGAEEEETTPPAEETPETPAE